MIRLLNVSRVSISGMSIELNLHGILGITMQKSSNVHVQMNVSCTKNNHILAAMSNSDYFCHFGLLSSESSHLFVDKMHAYKNLVRIGLHRTNNTIISNSKISHSEKYGLYITNTNNISLMNTIMFKNDRYGVFSRWAGNTVMENVIFHVHMDYVVLFQNSTNIDITYMRTFTSRGGFVRFDSCKDIAIRHFFATHHLPPPSIQ